MDTRSALRQRLVNEFTDTGLADSVIARVDDRLLPRIERMTGGDILGRALLFG